MSRKPDISAGLLVFRRSPELEVLLAHPGGPFWARKDDGAWTIPKGVVEAGADLDLATFASNTFEMEWPPRSGRSRSFPEIDRIAYFALPAAMTKIIEYQQPFLRELEAKIAM